MTYPVTFRYTRNHEWVEVKGGLGIIGLTDYAQCQLGDIVFVELPAVGASLEAGKPFGIVESVKTANEIYSPVSGEVVEVNGELKDAPENVNADPHGAGWLVKVRMKNATDVDALLDANAYETYLAPSDKGSSN